MALKLDLKFLETLNCSLYFKECVFVFIRYFVSKGAVVDQKGGILNATPLHWAVR